MSWLVPLLRRRAVLVATKAAIASGTAFYLGSLLPAPVDDYKYYAALGAFTVVGLALVDSVKESLQVFGAVALGVTVALVVQVLSWANAVTVAITIAVGVLLGATRIFGAQRTWAPLAALFVLATGGPDPQPIALGYLIQVPLGALVGVVVNVLVFAPLGDDELDTASSALLRLLSQQMRSYATLLEEQAATGDDPEAAARRGNLVHDNVVELEQAQSRLRSAILHARRAMRGNPRVRLNPHRHTPQLDRADAASRCAATLLAVGVMLDHSAPALDDDGVAMRRHAVTAMGHAAEVFADPSTAREQPGLVRSSEESIERMLRTARSPTAHEGLDSVLFGALALTIRDCLETFVHRIAGVDLPEADKHP